MFALNCFTFEKYNNLPIQKRNDITIKTKKIVISSPIQRNNIDFKNRIQKNSVEMKKPEFLQESKIDVMSDEKEPIKKESLSDEEENYINSEDNNDVNENNTAKFNKARWYQGIGFFILISFVIPVAYLIYDFRKYLITKINYYLPKNEIKIDPANKHKTSIEAEKGIEYDEYTFLDVL
ncbi:hypothetical protein GVAV_000383 [Gurleya vavrai]